MSQSFFHTDCPSCGAPVDVTSPTTVTVVCGYCNSMLVLENGGALNDTGRDSALIEDASPLQIGTQGHFGKLDFVLIGRLQARYDAGVWNEWYVRFADGSHGWLSEAGDLYVLLRAAKPPSHSPKFEDIRAGETQLHYNKTFIASDVRDITLSNAAAQGELPFSLPAQWHTSVVDWRCENHFLTLDYSQNPPLAFLGVVVDLDKLALTHTRDSHQIRQAAGKLKGERSSDHCPNCGSPVRWPHGLTQALICPACNSELAVDSGKAELLAANTLRHTQQQELTLPIGRQGTWRDTAVTVIGAVRYEELESNDALDLINGESTYATPVGWWIEYLLHSPKKGFIWLVQTSEDDWLESETLAHFPSLDEHGKPHGSRLAYRYGGRVSYAAGAFYWHIRAGDVTHYSDYANGRSKLCAEQSRNELAWSRSTLIDFNEEVAPAFKLSPRSEDEPEYSDTPIISNKLRRAFFAAYILINIPAWSMMLFAYVDIGALFISAIISYIVFKVLFAGDNHDDDDDDD